MTLTQSRKPLPAFLLVLVALSLLCCGSIYGAVKESKSLLEIGEALIELAEEEEDEIDYRKILGREDETFEEIIKREGEKEGNIVFSLEDCIFLALRFNDAIDTAYLGRFSQALSLESAQDQYLPNASVVLGEFSRSDRGIEKDGHTRGYTFRGPSFDIKQKLKTGGNIDFSWSNSTVLSNREGTSKTSTNWSVGFTQSLAKGFGREINTLTLTKAYLTEERNILNLETSVINQIDAVIKQYRKYMQAIVQEKIIESARIAADKTFEQTQLLFEAGRKAKLDLIAARAKKLEREFEEAEEEDNSERERLGLLRIINISLDTPLVPEPIKMFDLKQLPTEEEALKIARRHSQSYQRALITVRNAELDFLKAKNDRLFDLTLSGGLSNTDAGGVSSFSNVIDSAVSQNTMQWTLGLKLDAYSIPLFNRRNTKRFIVMIGARRALRESRITFNTVEENLKQSVKDNLRAIGRTKLQVKIAEINTILEKKKVAGDKITWEQGKSSSFQFLSRQDQLVAQEQNELTAKINFLNALNDLDKTLGTTLLTWNIDIDDRLARRPEYRNKFYKVTRKQGEQNSKYKNNALANN